MTIRTPIVDFGSKSTSVDIFTPATAALSTAEFKELLASIWLSALTTNARARWGIRFSNDAVDWDAPASLNIAGIGAPYASSIGWTFGSGWTDITAVSGTTHKLFFQLGIMGGNSSGSAIESGQARLSVQCKPLIARTLVLGPRRVWCVGNGGGTDVFVPFSKPIPAEDIAEIRGSVEVNGTTGATVAPLSRIGVICAWQQANKPDDPTDWTGTTTFGTRQNENGIAFGTTFTSITPTKRFVRFGASAINVDANDPQICQVTLRIDYRR